MFSDRQHLRRCAAQVLLTLLFSLAMGVVNACALADSANHLGGPATTVDSHEHDRGHADGEAAKADCLDFCEKSAISAPQLKAADAGLGALGFALPVSNTFLMSSVVDLSAGRLSVDLPRRPVGPPPRIAFLRLVL